MLSITFYRGVFYMLLRTFTVSEEFDFHVGEGTCFKRHLY